MGVSWFISMMFFSYVVYTLLIGLADATNSEPDVKVKKMLRNAQVVTCISWCTYPIVYLSRCSVSTAPGQCLRSRSATAFRTSSRSAWLACDLPDHHLQVR